MEKNMYSRPLSLRSMKINDKFWKQLILVRKKENARDIRDMRLQRWHWYVSMR